jgi:hypothetical protein
MEALKKATSDYDRYPCEGRPLGTKSSRRRVARVERFGATSDGIELALAVVEKRPMPLLR